MHRCEPKQLPVCCIFKTHINTLITMKKTLLTALAACALLIGGYTQALAGEPCNNSQTCQTSACKAQQGFEKVGEGAEEAAVNSYETVKDGTEKAYNKVKDGTVSTYNKARKGTVKTYNKAKKGTVKTYNKVKDGTEKAYKKAKKDAKGFWKKTKEEIHNAMD